jgi:NADH-quinone oxidoreductase subunit A
MGYWLLLPPICFAVICVVVLGLQVASRELATRGADAPGKRKAYACGENMERNRVQPSYDEFFPIAFFFTIMHVIVLILATVPQHGLKNFAGIIIFYLVAAGSGLFILFRETVESDIVRLHRFLLKLRASKDEGARA